MVGSTFEGSVLTYFFSLVTIQCPFFDLKNKNTINVRFHFSWGFTNETSTDPGRPGVAIENAPMAGVDGTCGVDDAC